MQIVLLISDTETLLLLLLRRQLLPQLTLLLRSPRRPLPTLVQAQSESSSVLFVFRISLSSFRGAGGLLGGLSALIPGGAGAAGGAGGAGGLGGLLGRKRQVIKSRIAGDKAGYWI